MAPLKYRNSKKLLSSSRPRIHKERSNGSHLSSRTTRNLIRSHHTLQKQLSHAIATNDDTLASSLRSQISAQGGIGKYQQASIQGQSNERGGDSSRVLVQWIKELAENGLKSRGSERSPLKLLEVGSLKVDNACARSNLFEMTRIDLHSQHRDILEQDFMERSVPSGDRLDIEGFDVVSLSLVVNYVGDATARGDMLKRVATFLRSPSLKDSGNGRIRPVFPCLFLVLPAPCILNSRYLDEGKLEEMLKILGYKLLRKKLSSKLVYYLWRLDPGEHLPHIEFTKEVLRQGGNRNNFAIILK